MPLSAENDEAPTSEQELREIVASSSDDTLVIRACLDLAKISYRVHPDSAKQYLQKAEKIALKASEMPGSSEIAETSRILLAKVYNNKGLLHKGCGEPYKALNNLFRSLEIKKDLKDSVGIAKSSYNIAGIYSNLNDYSNTLKYCFQSLEMSETIGDSAGIVYCRHLLGNTYLDLNDLESAVDYFLQNAELCRHANLENMLAHSYSNLGLAYNELGDFPAALDYQRKAAAIFEKLGMQDDLGIVYGNIGSMYKEKNELREAERFFSKAREIAEARDYKRGLAFIYYNLGDIELRRNNIANAKEYVAKCAGIADKLEYPKIYKDVAELNSKIAEKEGRYRDALEYFKEKTTWQDSIAGEANYMQMQTKQAQYKYEKQAVIDSLNFRKELELRDAEAKRKTFVRYVLIGLVVIMAVFFIVLYYNYDQKKKANAMLAEKTRKINEQKIELEEHKNNLENLVKQRTKELEAANKKLETLDESKSYFLGLLAHELSTPLNGIIGAANLITTTAEDPDSIEMSELILDSAYRLERFSELARLITNLRLGNYHVVYNKVPFVHLMKDVINVFKARYKEEEKEIQINNNTLDDSLELFIDEYLITQAVRYVLDNTVKFSDKDKVVVDIDEEKTETHYSLIIRDNGPGFTEKALENVFTMFSSDELMNHSEGLGLSLTSVKMIMEYHDGNIGISNGPKEGAVVKITLPVERTKQDS